MSHIIVTKAQGVLEIRLARPEKKNAITSAMYAAVADALEGAAADAAVRAILFTADGDGFSAGNDLMDFAGAATMSADFASLPVTRVLMALAQAEKPLVAAVRGAAIGIGTTMLLHCDLVFVAEDARLSTPFINLALVPEAASSLLLPARLGHARAFAMFALGEALTGLEATTLGLANKAMPAADVDAAARAAAAQLATKPPEAVRITKRLMRDAALLQDIIRREGALFMQRLKSPEAAEAFTAFMERRPADFSRFG